MMDAEEEAEKMKKVLLSAKDLSKSYVTDRVQNHVINHLDLEIYEGDFTVIMGPSGSGKSTLLYNLSGMEEASGGRIYLEDRELTGLQENALTDLRLHTFGFVFQQIHLISNLNLFENIVLPGYLAKAEPDRVLQDRALDLLQKFQLDQAQKRLPSQVSGGEQQRAAIARALINRPKLLFADEPTGALNRKNSDIILDLFTQIHGQGQTIVMVTHDPRAALRANRILYILDGKVKGDLDLPPYALQDLTDRETQVTSWLRSLEW